MPLLVSHGGCFKGVCNEGTIGNKFPYLNKPGPYIMETLGDILNNYHMA